MGGSSIPIGEIVIKNVGNSDNIFEIMPNSVRGGNVISVWASFYNGKVGFWEPIIENWNFMANLDISFEKESWNKVKIISNDNDLNLNISDEFVNLLV
jgi:hypothetical protein